MKREMKREMKKRQPRTIGRSTTAVCGALLISSLAAPPLQAAPEGIPTGAEINAAVDSDLLYDSSVSSNDLDVSTTNGIVTLSGSAPNILAKERAVTIAEAVRGVRAVVNNISVKPVLRTDDEVQRDVKFALLGDPAADSYEVNVAVKDGVVTLTGTVQSWQEKQLSAAVAKGVKGVKELKNDIIVHYKVERPDSQIAPEVKAVLKRDVWVDDILINSTVRDGKVTLTGTVGSAAEKTRAVSDAWITGVTSVDADGLQVEPWAKDTMKKSDKVAFKSDEAIKNAVRDALLYDPRVLSFNPTVAVSNGVVTLTGAVDNLKAKRAAEQDAKNTVGVWRVKNYLRVRVENPPTDDKLAQNVKDALIRDPYVDRFQIAVSALNGVIYLTGTVDSYYEKSHAEDVVSRVNGVTTVNNGLSVSYPTYKHYYWPYSYNYYEPYYNWSTDYTVWPYTSDAELKDEIESELFWSPFVDSDDVKVEVENGTATLTGTVDSWSEYESASENAQEGGADIVINKLKVE